MVNRLSISGGGSIAARSLPERLYCGDDVTLTGAIFTQLSIPLVPEWAPLQQDLVWQYPDVVQIATLLQQSRLHCGTANGQ
jgi:hypothetical protein